MGKKTEIQIIGARYQSTIDVDTQKMQSLTELIFNIDYLHVKKIQPAGKTPFMYILFDGNERPVFKIEPIEDMEDIC